MSYLVISAATPSSLVVLRAPSRAPRTSPQWLALSARVSSRRIAEIVATNQPADAIPGDSARGMHDTLYTSPLFLWDRHSNARDEVPPRVLGEIVRVDLEFVTLLDGSRALTNITLTALVDGDAVPASTQFSWGQLYGDDNVTPVLPVVEVSFTNRPRIRGTKVERISAPPIAPFAPDVVRAVFASAHTSGLVDVESSPAVAPTHALAPAVEAPTIAPAEPAPAIAHELPPASVVDATPPLVALAFPDDRMKIEEHALSAESASAPPLLSNTLSEGDPSIPESTMTATSTETPVETPAPAAQAVAAPKLAAEHALAPAVAPAQTAVPTQTTVVIDGGISRAQHALELSEKERAIAEREKRIAELEARERSAQHELRQERFRGSHPSVANALAVVHGKAKADASPVGRALELANCLHALAAVHDGEYADATVQRAEAILHEISTPPAAPAQATDFRGATVHALPDAPVRAIKRKADDMPMPEDFGM